MRLPNVKSNSQYSSKEELANTLTHGIGTLLSVIGLIFLLIHSTNQENTLKTISFIIYGSSLTLLLLASTLYHAINNDKLKKTLKIIDHSAIYLLIAGTYTPLIIVSLSSSDGSTQTLLFIIWGLALLGIAFKVLFGTRYKAISLMTYLGMGYISLLILKDLYVALPIEGLILLITGGLLYSLGVIFYVRNSLTYNHAIWHMFVLAAAGCHYFMMFYL